MNGLILELENSDYLYKKRPLLFIIAQTDGYIFQFPQLVEILSGIKRNPML